MPQHRGCAAKAQDHQRGKDDRYYTYIHTFGSFRHFGHTGRPWQCQTAKSSVNSLIIPPETMRSCQENWSHGTGASQATVQTIQTSFQTFGEVISANQKTSAEAVDNRLKDLNTRFSAMAVENEQKLENIRMSMERKISALTEDNNKQLEQMRQTVDEKLQKTLEDRIGQSFKVVSERLEAVYKGLGEMQNLAAGVGDLKKVLSQCKDQGHTGRSAAGRYTGTDPFARNSMKKMSMSKAQAPSG